MNDKVQTIEELSLNALPCLQQILDEGWILRFAEGYTKRANSITPLYSHDGDLVSKIERCERAYRELNLKPIFRITNESRLEKLDRTLAELGYVKQDWVSVRVKKISSPDFSADSDLKATLDREVSEEWLDRYVHAANVPVQHWNTLSTMLDIIPHSTCYAMLKKRSLFCSCGLGVLAKNYLGLYFVATTKQQQGKGYAQKLISAMLQWGQDNGATQAYVQVETKNLRAINLYNKLGFVEAYQYFYRTKPE
ncbi:MAG: GNAT family N-acetyltransferase [Chloroflexota bacterium]